MTPTGTSRHDQRAPFWAGALVLLCATGLSTTFIPGNAFWHGYVLDMTGPAWTYILVRGLFTAESRNRWTRTFTPVFTFAICTLVLFAIEGSQYLQWYAATFDPWDFVAYISLLLPAFIIDLYQFWKDAGAAVDVITS